MGKLPGGGAPFGPARLRPGAAPRAARGSRSPLPAQGGSEGSPEGSPEGTGRRGAPGPEAPPPAQPSPAQARPYPLRPGRLPALPHGLAVWAAARPSAGAEQGSDTASPRLSPARPRRGSPSSRGARLGPVGGEGGSRCTARGAVVFRKRGCTSTLK